jgi:predicted TIM-barrel fold metal-dependent hydrolase
VVTEHEAWLNLAIEDPIDPGLPICDAHHHLWNCPNDRYLVRELMHDIGEGHNIVQTVFIECNTMYRKDGPPELRPVGETALVRRITTRSASRPCGQTKVAAGIVGFANLLLGDAAVPVLEAHIEAGKGRFRGVRFSAAWDEREELKLSSNPPKGLLMDLKFREGFACLQKFSLSFETWVYQTQLMELVDLAKAYPDTPIIVNHLGGLLGVSVSPYTEKREEAIQEWKRGTAALAACPNVYMKLGVGGVPLRGFGWHKRITPPASVELSEVMAPYVHWCIEQFGVDRCMFESNYPVNKVVYSYTVLWNAFKQITKGFSVEECNAIFHDTAVKAYRLASVHKG